jgi:putative transposase
LAIPSRNGRIPGTYFVTSKAWQGRALFFREESCEVFLENLFAHRAKGAYKLHLYVLMPDHFHLLITPAPDKTLERVVQLIKGGSAHALGLVHQSTFPVWQRGFSDHRIRDARDFSEHVTYIEQNPVRRGLVENARDFAWSSATTSAEWDDAPQGLKPIKCSAAVGTAKAVP